jgi:hypothetical protein
MKKILKATWWLLSLFVVSDIVLKSLGFGYPVQFEGNSAYQYRNIPNQNKFRFGNYIRTNSVGMRSQEPNPSKNKILKIGDSIINGGAHTDQKELSSSIIEEHLKKRNCQVLNVSAGSWGPDNAHAFLQKHGTFDAKLAIVTFSSHDAYDYIEPKTSIGKTTNYPDKVYFFAFQEILERFVLKKVLFPKDDGIEVNIKPYPRIYPNIGFSMLIQYLRENGVQVLFVQHPDLNELKAESYNKHGQVILTLLSELKVPVIQGIDFLTEDCYRDEIHLNAFGQKKYAEVLTPVIISQLDELGL